MRLHQGKRQRGLTGKPRHKDETHAGIRSALMRLPKEAGSMLQNLQLLCSRQLSQNHTHWNTSALVRLQNEAGSMFQHLQPTSHRSTLMSTAESQP